MKMMHIFHIYILYIIYIPCTPDSSCDGTYLYGNSKKDAHVYSEISNLICLRHLFDSSRNFDFFSAEKPDYLHTCAKFSEYHLTRVPVSLKTNCDAISFKLNRLYIWIVICYEIYVELRVSLKHFLFEFNSFNINPDSPMSLSRI